MNEVSERNIRAPNLILNNVLESHSDKAISHDSNFVSNVIDSFIIESIT